MLDNMYKTPDGAALRFFVEPQRNGFQSEKLGRPIFDTVLMVEVITPGSKDSTPCFECERVFSDASKSPDGTKMPDRRTAYFEKYKPQIEAFRNASESGDMRGTPIEQWPAIDVATAASCKEARVYTVEGLAALPDSALPVLGPGALSLRERAKAFLEAAQGNAGHEALAAENVQLRADVGRLSAAVEALGKAQTGSVTVDPLTGLTPPPPPAVDPLAPAVQKLATVVPPPPPASTGKKSKEPIV